MALITTVASGDGFSTERVGRALRSLHDAEPCGDQLDCWDAGSGMRLALADGLGHGSAAYAAAAAAMDTLRQFTEHADMALETAFAECNRRLLSTRGVALAVVDICDRRSTFLHAAVGNVRTLLVQNGRVTRLSGARGIVGAGFRGLRSEYLPIVSGDWLVIFSDGIPENADLAADLVDQDPSDRLAARLLDRWADARDDASLLLYRHT